MDGRLRSLYYLLCFICGCQYSSRAQHGSGVYVYRYFTKQPNTGQLVKMFPDDSIFYHDGYAIEKVMAIHDQIENEMTTTTEKLHGYYFIDSGAERFFPFSSLNSASHSNNASWIKLSGKPMGLQLYFPYYNGEKVLQKDTLLREVLSIN